MTAAALWAELGEGLFNMTTITDHLLLAVALVVLSYILSTLIVQVEGVSVCDEVQVQGFAVYDHYKPVVSYDYEVQHVIIIMQLSGF